MGILARSKQHAAVRQSPGRPPPSQESSKRCIDAPGHNLALARELCGIPSLIPGSSSRKPTRCTRARHEPPPDSDPVQVLFGHSPLPWKRLLSVAWQYKARCPTTRNSPPDQRKRVHNSRRIRLLSENKRWPASDFVSCASSIQSVLANRPRMLWGSLDGSAVHSLEVQPEPCQRCLLRPRRGQIHLG